MSETRREELCKRAEDLEKVLYGLDVSERLVLLFGKIKTTVHSADYSSLSLSQTRMMATVGLLAIDDIQHMNWMIRGEMKEDRNEG